MQAATSSKCSTSGSSARPRFARPRSSFSSRRAIASTPKPWCARFRKKESGFRCPDAGGVFVPLAGGVFVPLAGGVFVPLAGGFVAFVALLQLFIRHAKLRFLGLV